MNRLGTKGGTLTLAAGSSLELSMKTFEGGGSWKIRAGEGNRRPQIRFRPLLSDLIKPPLAWTVLLDLPAGSLDVEGIDLIIPDSDTTSTGRIAAIGLAGGASLSLTDCTLTMAGRPTNFAALVVLPASTEPRRGTSDSADTIPRIAIRDCFIRTGGDLLTIPSARPAELEVTNSLIASEGSLVHARGGRSKSSEAPIRLGLKLERTTVRADGGLVHLEGVPGEPDLPQASIQAAHSIVGLSDGDDPLVRVDGHEQSLDSLKDRIRWEGNRVGYYQVRVYRRDQVNRTGVFSTLYNRQDWTAAARTDRQAIHEDLKFQNWSPSTPAWKVRRDDFQLVSGSALAGDGPDLLKIPRAPSESDS
jgi:serine/threonine-protein kinase